MRATPLISTTLLLGLLSGCVDHFDTPSAFDTESYLCDDDEAMARYMSGCLEKMSDGEGCGGAVSFTGKLQGSDLTVDSYVVRADLLVELDDSKTSTVIRRFDIYGAGTYFKFNLVLYSLGTTVSSTATVEREFSIDSEAERMKSESGDDYVDISMRLNAAGESAEIHALTGSGALSMQIESTDELRGRFHAAFETLENRLEGCFRAFPTATISERK